MRVLALACLFSCLACVERSSEPEDFQRRPSEPTEDPPAFDASHDGGAPGDAMGGTSSAEAGAVGPETGGAGSSPEIGGGGSGGSAGSAGGAMNGSGGSNEAPVADAGDGGSGGEREGEAGGEAGSEGASAGAAGFGGSPGEVDPTPRSCNSSDGSGCNEGEVCLDTVSDSCVPGGGEDCPGTCATTLPPSSCEGGLAHCGGTPTCSDPPPECPPGLVASFVDDCYGPCVPADCCQCSSALDCWPGDVSCDLTAGRCVAPAAPEPRCFLPFDPGACLATFPTFAFIDDECTETSWGGCEGNDNRFNTLEECLRRCEGLPQQGECPDGRVITQACLQCGVVGGCVDMATVCAESCETTDYCTMGTVCSESTCIRVCF